MKLQLTQGKLGYGGTKSEMERLIKDAAKIDKSIDSNSLSYANVVKAIHAVQKNMDITGTTAKEAEHTITGSLSSLKSSWGNLMTSLVTGGDDFDQCVNNLVESALTFKDNIMPALVKALSGLGTLIERLAPTLEEHFPKLVEELLPPLIKAATALVKGFIKSLPAIIKIIIQELPYIVKSIGEAIADICGGKSWVGPITKAVGVAGSVILGALVAFKGFKAYKAITSIFSQIGGTTKRVSKGTKSISGFADIKTKTVLKGMSNLAIVIGGLTVIAAALALVAPHIAKLSDAKSLIEVVSLISVLGVVGAGLSKLAGWVGNIPVATVSKGLANIAIIISGMSALFLLIGAVSLINFDLNKIMHITKIITVLGVLGSALSILAGIVGLIPIPVVLAGLANIALVIGGMTGLIIAYGALSEIKGFNDFLTKGGETLSKLFNAIGKIAGSLVGGFGEGLSDALPKIGENLSKFATSLKPMFTMFQGVDMSGAGAFFSALGSFMLKMAGEKLFSIFTGGTNLSQLGTELTGFANNSAGFFTKVAQLPANGFENAKLMFNALAGINGLPKEGGLVQWFSGTINYASLANGLGQLSTEKVVRFFNTVAKIPQVAFDNTKLLFDTLAGVKSLPKEGGLVQWFTGTINYASLADGLGQLSSEKVVRFFNTVAAFPQIAFDNTKSLFATLAECKGLPKSGGLFQWFTGDSLTTMETLSAKLPPFGMAVASFYAAIAGISDFTRIKQLFEALGSIDDNVDSDGGLINWAIKIAKGDEKTGLEKLGDALKSFGNATKTFFDQVNKLNLNNLNGLWDSLKRPENISANTLKVLSENIDKIVAKVEKLPQQMGDGIRNGGDSLKESLVSIWVEAAKAMTAPVNKIIEGANWILGEFGSDKKIASWTPYAKGTTGHKGGNALVNDGRGAELVQMPNGRTFIPQGRNVFLPGAPKGMKVLPAEQTARLMGKKSPAFRYAKGTGDIDIWSYIDDSKGLVNAVSDKYVSYDGMSGFALSAGKGMVSTIKEAMGSWSKKLFDEFGAKSIADYVASAGVEQWRSTVIRALKMENQYSEANVKRTLFQMQTESGGNPKAINLWDSNAKKGIPSKGLMQVIDPTFQAYARPGFNSNSYDPLSNILASIRYAVSRYGSLSNAYKGVGYSNGVGVDLSSYTPENSGSTVVNSRNTENVENNSFSPTFNLYISGATDERTMSRKVQRWVKEAINEMAESMNRKNPACIKI